MFSDFYYPCDKQGYYSRVPDSFPLKNFMHRISNFRTLHARLKAVLELLKECVEFAIDLIRLVCFRLEQFHLNQFKLIAYCFHVEIFSGNSLFCKVCSAILIWLFCI